MKKKGFLLLDILVSIGLFSFIALNLLVLMNKNIKNFRIITSKQETERLINNIENILKRDFYKKKLQYKYEIEEKEIENIYLKNLENNNIESLGRYSQISFKEIKNIKIVDKKVNINQKEIGKISFVQIEINGKIIEKVIEEKYEEK